MALSSLPAVTVCKSEPIDVDSDDDTEVIKTFIYNLQTSKEIYFANWSDQTFYTTMFYKFTDFWKEQG